MSSEAEAEATPSDSGDVMRCDGCRWWVVVDRWAGNGHVDDKAGLCQRFPPVLNHHGVADDIAFDEEKAESPSSDFPINAAKNHWNWVFPVTTGSQFCGEHKST